MTTIRPRENPSRTAALVKSKGKKLLSQLAEWIKKVSEQNAGSVSCSTQLLQDGILCLAFEGYYPPGSEGTHVANEMVKYTLAAYNCHNPRALLFDFEKLDYVWGDGVCLPAMYLGFERKEMPLSLPVCVLAHGRTHKALEGLFGNRNMCFGLVGARLFDDREKAMAYLEAELYRT